MPYEASVSIGPTASGLTLKWSLVSGAGTLDATLRNQTSGFTALGTSGYYVWRSTTLPDGFRGSIVFHTGSDVSTLSDFTASTVRAVQGVNPAAVERPEKALPDAAANSSGGLYILDGNGVDVGSIAGSSGAATALTFLRIAEGTMTGTPTTLTFDVSLSVDASTVEGAIVRFTSGVASGQYRQVLSYDGTTITLNHALASAPTAGDSFTLLASPQDIFSVRGNIEGHLIGNVQGNVDGSVGSVATDVLGKVLGGGAGTISGVGVRAVDGSGNAIATASAVQGLRLASGTVASTTGTTTTLDSGAAATADYYVNARLVLISGTGAGQERSITAWSASRVATHAAWATNPTASTTYAILPARVVATADSSAIATAVAGELGTQLDEIQAKTDLLTGPVRYAGPVDVAAGFALRLVAGDSYDAGTRVPGWTFTKSDWPDMTSATVKLRIGDVGAYTAGSSAPSQVEVSGSFTIGATEFDVAVPLSAANTLALTVPPPTGTGKPTHSYQLVATTSAGKVISLAIGSAFVTRRITPAA